MNDTVAEEILFERRGHAGIATLNRPKALNAVTHSMVDALAAQLAEWAADDAVKVVVIRGEGRAFSAGGDILDVYRAGKAGERPVGFFADEYRLNAAIRRFPKPYVALIDGIVMGGGFGLSFHGSHRIVGEKALFAMPEVGIGFFPDVGGSYVLSRLKGGFGMYLALTATRIGPGELLWSGLATGAVASADLDAVLHDIAEAGDPAAALKGRAINPERQINEARIAAIGHHFTRGSLEDTVASLRQAADSGDDFAAATLQTMVTKSPTSLHVTFRQIAAGAMLSMDDCMRMEYRILNRMLAGRDFYEGIRAVLVDKGDTPKWDPATLAEVSDDDVEAYFAPLPEGELEL